MASTSEDGELVDLQGYAVPLAALKVGWHLEESGCALSVHRAGTDAPTLRVRGADGRKPDLSSEMLAKIRRWKSHLIVLIDWVEARTQNTAVGERKS